MSNPLRSDIHSLIGDFKDAVRDIENAWGARDGAAAKTYLRDAGARADECMVRLRALL